MDGKEDEDEDEVAAVTKLTRNLFLAGVNQMQPCSAVDRKDRTHACRRAGWSSKLPFLEVACDVNTKLLG